jgi:iron complex outermembrane receptor protein
MPSVYDYERYSPMNGMKPGRGVTSTNASIVYQNNWNNFTLETGLSGNYEQTQLYNIIGDSLPYDNIVYYAFWGGYDDGPELQITEGAFQTQSWRNYNISGVLKLMYNYDAGNLGKGDLLVGMQYDYFNLYYHDMSVGDNFDRVLYTAMNDYDPLIKNNHETNYSVYSQLKHNFNEHFILNIGLRFDNKERYVGSAKRVLSPRAAMIWKPNKKTAFKLSYSRSFVDAPYFYRASERIYQGNEDLTPQYLDNIQLTGFFRIPSLNLEYENNIFYTYMRDIINLDMGSYINSGTVKSIGFENILTYRYKDWMARGSFYTHKILKSEGVSANDDEIYSIPNWTAHIQVSKMFFDHLRLMTNLSYTSKCKSRVSTEYFYHNGEPITQTVRDFPACFIADLGAAYQWKSIELSVKCKNLFNKKYRYGGDRVPVLQEGRNFMATLTLNIKD